MESGGPGLEACVAQLTYTGFVHADPHEGNLLLDRSDGSLVFLDFGLVSEVEPFVMVGDGTGAAFTRRRHSIHSRLRAWRLCVCITR